MFRYTSAVKRAGILALSCAMLSAAPISVYFTPAAANDMNGAYTNFIRYIDSARESIHLCLYEMDLIDVAARLAAKKQNGVKVSLFMESDATNNPRNGAALSILSKANIPVRFDRRGSLMHNKFILVDIRRVWIGSANITERGFFYNYNDCILIEDAVVAGRYYEHYLSLVDPLTFPGQLASKQNRFTVGDVPVEVYFSPGDGITGHYTAAVAKARDRIRFLCFAFSSLPLAYAMNERERDGVIVSGIFDDTFTDGLAKTKRLLPYDILKDQRLSYIAKDNDAAKIHHKCIMLDDDTVLTGSFNFSLNAERNDENAVIIKSKNVARRYISRYEELWREASEIPLRKFLQEAPDDEAKRACYRLAATAMDDIIKKGAFSGIVHEIVSGDTVRIAVSNMNELCTVRLYGIRAPYQGYRSQYPQLAYTRQFIAHEIMRHAVTVRFIRTNGFLSCEGIINVPGTVVSINEKMLADGFALPSTGMTSNTVNAGMIQAYMTASRQRRGLWSPELTLKESPEEFAARIKHEAMAKAERENTIALAAYDEGCLIGNRASRKFYLPGDVRYRSILARTSQDKLIYFKSEGDALNAGYARSGQ
ncbi:MAG: hypothetical protein HZC28_01220 [Spirochaetes bacterium]|nr:hypothetical protein [Spirochaetota bacterium]